MKIIIPKAVQLTFLQLFFVLGLLSPAKAQNIYEMSPETFDYYANEFAEILKAEQLADRTAIDIAGVKLADKCEIFMKKEDLLGPIGQKVFDLVDGKGADFPHVLAGGNVTRYCSRYSAMSRDQRAFVWALIMTTIAHFESSCRITASIKGPNGRTWGFYQLHKGQESRYERGAKNYCPKNASQDPKISTACALSMIDDQLKRTDGNLFSRDSYWDVLRPNGEARKADDIQRALARFSLCNPKRI
jgi:hypothetical protein